LGWQERLPLCSHVVPFAVIWLERAKKVFVRCLMFHLHCYWLGELSKVPPHLAAKAGPIHNRNQKEIIVAVPD